MPPDLRHREWHEDPPEYVFSAGENSDLFSVEVCHNGFFCGLKENLSYVSSSTGFFDYCSAQNWSTACMDEILKMLDYVRDGKLHVYWCLPGKDITNGLVPMDRDAHFQEMKKMEKMKTDSQLAYDWIEQLVPNTWIKAFFKEFPKCDLLLNNHSEVFNSYILGARELPCLSMLESIFYKIMQRLHGKEKEARKWKGRICPKIKKKLDKFIEWSNECQVKPANNYLYAVSSHEVDKFYTVDFKTKTCDCKKWQLTGIPCHHAIACCRHDKINPESLVHNCYTIETYMKAYEFKLAPLRGRVFWDKVNGVKIHPPLYTKVMGRPKKNRKKAPEEKIKRGVKVLTKSGVTMHCSVCGQPDHNKKGHQKYVDRQLQQQRENIICEDDDIDIPSILEHVIPHIPNPTLDPTNQQDSMVYRMGEEERDNVPVERYLGPLPENAFVAAARESIPQPNVRVTTASTRGNLRGRGRGRSTATGEASRASSGRGRGKGKKRSAEASARAENPEVEATARANSSAQNPQARATASGTAEKRVYNTGPGSAYYLLFGDDEQRRATELPDLNFEAIPDLNVQDFVISQNAPTNEDV